MFVADSTEVFREEVEMGVQHVYFQRHITSYDFVVLNQLTNKFSVIFRPVVF